MASRKAWWGVPTSLWLYRGSLYGGQACVECAGGLPCWALFSGQGGQSNDLGCLFPGHLCHTGI